VKKTLIIGLLLLTIIEASAQLDFSFKAGANISNWVMNPRVHQYDLSRYNKIGYQAGIKGNYQWDGNLNLTGELLYSNKGLGVLHFNYLNLPILGGYRIGRFNIEIGPEIGFLINAYQKGDHRKGALTEYYPRFDLSLIGGLTFEITDRININLRFVQEIVPIDSFFLTRDGINGVTIKQFNRSIQLSVSYIIE